MNCSSFSSSSSVIGACAPPCTSFLSFCLDNECLSFRRVAEEPLPGIVCGAALDSAKEESVGGDEDEDVEEDDDEEDVEEEDDEEDVEEDDDDEEDVEEDDAEDEDAEEVVEEDEDEPAGETGRTGDCAPPPWMMHTSGSGSVLSSAEVASTCVGGICVRVVSAAGGAVCGGDVSSVPPFKMVCPLRAQER